MVQFEFAKCRPRDIVAGGVLMCVHPAVGVRHLWIYRTSVCPVESRSISKTSEKHNNKCKINSRVFGIWSSLASPKAKRRNEEKKNNETVCRSGLTRIALKSTQYFGTVLFFLLFGGNEWISVTSMMSCRWSSATKCSDFLYDFVVSVVAKVLSLERKFRQESRIVRILARNIGLCVYLCVCVLSSFFLARPCGALSFVYKMCNGNR